LFLFNYFNDSYTTKGTSLNALNYYTIIGTGYMIHTFLDY